jgi:hypothetical protein
MKYQDDANKHTVNGVCVGVRTGSPMQDAANPTDDGYEHLRQTEHVGTVLQDAADDNPIPEEE